MVVRHFVKIQPISNHSQVVHRRLFIERVRFNLNVAAMSARLMNNNLRGRLVSVRLYVKAFHSFITITLPPENGSNWIAISTALLGVAPAIIAAIA